MGDYWEDRKNRLGWGEEPKALPIPTLPTGELGPRDRAYAQGALRSEAAELAGTASHRNDRLNTAAIKLSGYVNAGTLTRDEVEVTLTEAGRTASALGDHPFTDSEIAATLASGLGAGRAKGTLKGPPDDGQVREVSAAELNGHSHAEPAQSTNGAVATNGAALTEDEKQDLHHLKVLGRAYDLRVADEARSMWTRQRATLAGQRPPQAVNLHDLLAQPDPAVVYRIAELLPAGGRALLAAQYKAGKTSMIANLLRSLVDGDKFLGRFNVEPVASVWLIDTELDQDMLRRWLRDQGIRNAKAVQTLCLKGRLTTFGITDDTTRADWAERMAGADFVILDCLRPCLDALGLSEDKEAGIFLTAFDALCLESGAREATVVQHMGHGQERSRGDSRQLDWPDVNWRIVRDSDDDSGLGDRFFSALGRDVNVPEALLDWTPETRSLMLCDGSRADKRARSTIEEIVDILSDPANLDGLSKNQLVGKLKALGTPRDRARHAIDMAVIDGALVTTEGPRRSEIHILNPTRRNR